MNFLKSEVKYKNIKKKYYENGIQQKMYTLDNTTTMLKL